jgi:hypothetical protein
VRTVTNYTGRPTTDCHISILVFKKYQSAVGHPVYGGYRKGGNSDSSSSLRPCRWRQYISPKGQYPSTALHGVTKHEQCTVNSSSFCYSLSRVPERTATTCEPLHPAGRGGGTGGIPAHGEWPGNPLQPDNIPVKVIGERLVHMKCQ